MNYTALESVATAIGAALTAIGVVAAWRIADRAAQLDASAHHVAMLTALQDWRRDLRDWASQVIEQMWDLQSKVTETSSTSVEVGRLSALLDTGRLFFPNQDADKYGSRKIEAYRGWRHAVLDPIEAAVGVASGRRDLGKYKTRQAAVADMRRHFVSRVQRIIAPQVYNQLIAELSKAELQSDDPTMGGLLPSPGEIPSGADALLHGTARGLVNVDTKFRPLVEPTDDAPSAR